MKKTVLIPTDYTIESLNVLKALLEREAGSHTYDIILLQGIHLSDSISELLFFSRNKVTESLTNQEFESACDVIRNKYASQIHSIRKDIYTGFTQAAFNNYAEANNISEAYIPSSYTLLQNKKSFDLLPYIRKSKLEITEVSWNADVKMPEKGKLAELFFNNITK